MAELISQKYIVVPWLSLKGLADLGHKEKTSNAWQEVAKLRNEINENWKGPNAVEEIRDQRTKITL